MTIRITALRNPSACKHLHIDYTVNGGATRTLAIDRADLKAERPEDPAAAITQAIRHVLLNENLSTFAEIRTALLNRTLEV